MFIKMGELYFNDKVIPFTMKYLENNDCECYLFPDYRRYKEFKMPVSCHCVIYNENDPENFGTYYLTGRKRVLYFPVFVISKSRKWKFYEEHDYYPWDWNIDVFWENKDDLKISQNILVDILKYGKKSQYLDEFLTVVEKCTKVLRMKNC